MCGLIAAFGEPGFLRSEDLDAAIDSMARRGPDARGVWWGNDVALGHRRLAILDLDTRSVQPMHSSTQRYSIVFNGEIYNFRELRSDLEKDGVIFRTSSDTEVLLELFAKHAERMLPLLRGMFAIAIWDSLENKGFIARDPYGIKPLYYTCGGKGVVVASQVKALLATGQISRAPDPYGQAGFWLLGSVPEPHTWFRDIRALPAGHCAWIDRGVLLGPTRWADIGDAWREASGENISLTEVRQRVREALQHSVAAHLVSDVPVGVFLSGGIDSGALAGLMVEAGASGLQGITLGFPEFAGEIDDETPVAAQVAAHYGIKHHIRTVTRDEFLGDLPRILHAMDQPSIDGINTWYASKAVAELGLKVVVSGVGGDELFQGYSLFRTLPRLVSTWGVLARLPGAMRVAEAAAALQTRRTGNPRWRDVPHHSRSLAGAWWLRRGVFSHSDLGRLMGRDLAAEVAPLQPEEWIAQMSGPLARDSRLALGQIESATYLRNQLLRDSDWASMDHSVELRTPLVDAWLLRDVKPLLGSFSKFPQKALLADAPTPPLPADVQQRRKTGFGIPMARWLQVDSGLSGGTGSRSWSREVVSSYQQFA